MNFHQISKKGTHTADVTRYGEGIQWSLAWGAHSQAPRFSSRTVSWDHDAQSFLSGRSFSVRVGNSKLLAGASI